MLNFKSVTPRGAFAFGLDVPTLKLDYQGIVVLIGENGSGKSALMNSISQALFGKNDTPGDGDEIANVVLKEGCDVVLEVEVNGKPYTAEYVRRFKRPGSTARVTDEFLFEGDKDIREESMSATFARIRSLVGMDYDQFRATSYLGIQNAPRFLNGTDGDRMSVITPFLGLGIWDRTQISVREKKKISLDLLAQAKGKLEYLEEQLASTAEKVLSSDQIETQSSAIEDAKSQIGIRKAEIDRIKASTTTVDNRLRVLEADITRLEAEVRVHKKSLSDVKTEKVRRVHEINGSFPEIDRGPLEEKQKLKREVEKKVQSERSTLERSLADLKKLTIESKGVVSKMDQDVAESKSLSAKLQDLKKDLSHVADSLAKMPEDSLGECPTCYTEVDPSHLAQVRLDFQNKVSALEKSTVEIDTRVKRLSRQAIEALQAHVTETAATLKAEIDALDEDAGVQLGQIDGFITDEETRIEAFVDEWRTKQVKQAEVGYAAKIGELEALLTKVNTALASINAERGTLKLDPTTLKNRDRVSALQKEINAVEISLKESERKIADSNLYADQVTQLETEQDTVATSIRGLETQVDDLAFLDAHLGDKGIKRFKLRDCLGFMNNKLAEYMAIMGLPFQVWFQDRIIKKTSLKKNIELLTDEDWTDRFEIFVTDGLKTGVPVGLYSGGERTLISLAILGVLWESANTFGSSGSNLLMIDEPFGLLREENQEKALALFEYWGGLRKCIIVSDNTQAIDTIGRRAATWQITKNGHISTIKVA